MPLAWGAPGTTSMPAAPSWDPTANHPQVQRLAEQVVDGKLRLAVGITQDQSKGPFQALVALLRSPQCNIKQLAFIHSKIGADGVASLSQALKVNRTFTWQCGCKASPACKCRRARRRDKLKRQVQCGPDAGFGRTTMASLCPKLTHTRRAGRNTQYAAAPLRLVWPVPRSVQMSPFETRPSCPDDFSPLARPWPGDAQRSAGSQIRFLAL